MANHTSRTGPNSSKNSRMARCARRILKPVRNSASFTESSARDGMGLRPSGLRTAAGGSSCMLSFSNLLHNCNDVRRGKVPPENNDFQVNAPIYFRAAAVVYLEPMPTFAAIDVGSNSCRLKIARVVSHQLKTLHEDREVTRLGSSVFESGLISPEAMAATLRALKRFQRAVQAHAPDRIRVVATSA